MKTLGKTGETRPDIRLTAGILLVPIEPVPPIQNHGLHRRKPECVIVDFGANQAALGLENPQALPHYRSQIRNMLKRPDRDDTIEGGIGERHVTRIALDKGRETVANLVMHHRVRRR